MYRLLIAFLLLITPAAAQERPTVYDFSADGLYKGARPAHMQPTGEPLIGRNQTLVAPPDASVDEWPRWTGSEWELVEMHRGKYVWNTESGRKERLFPRNPAVQYKYGPLPEGYTFLSPLGVECEEWQGVQWGINQECADALAEEMAQAGAIAADQDRKNLAEKARNASPEQIRAYVQQLFPNLTQAQYRFLAALVMLARDKSE